MHSNLLSLFGISAPKKFSSIIYLSPIHINSGVLIRKDGHCKMRVNLNGFPLNGMKQWHLHTVYTRIGFHLQFTQKHYTNTIVCIYMLSINTCIHLHLYFLYGRRINFPLSPDFFRIFIATDIIGKEPQYNQNISTNIWPE